MSTLAELVVEYIPNLSEMQRGIFTAWHTIEYAKQGKRYPSPRKQKSKARMSKKWRNLCQN